MRTSDRFDRSFVSISVVIWNRIGSSSSSRPVKQTVLPLWGVAEAKMRCSNRKRISRSIRVRWLARPPFCGAKWWASSTISRSHGAWAVVPIAARLRVRTGPGRLEELPQHVGHPEVVHRRDDAGEGFPGVRVDPQAAAKLERRVRVDDLEVEVELPAQFVLPLPLEHRRADDEDAADAAAQEQFFEDQPRLDRLAQPHPVGEEQADSGHRQGLEDGLQLVGVDLDGRVPDPEERLVLDALALTEPVQPGPAVGVHERPQRLGAVGAVGIDPRQGGRPQHRGRGLDLPEQLLRLGVSPVVEVLDIDDVEAALGGAGVVGFDGTDRRQAVADPDRLADFGCLGCRAGDHGRGPQFIRRSGQPLRWNPRSNLRTLRRMGLAWEASSLADPGRPDKARDGKS